MRRPKKEIYIVLDNIRSAHNVGSIFRTADAAGVSRVFLCGITPKPGQQGKAGRELAKTALGAEEYVLWEHRKNTLKLVEKLKQEGIFVAALEQSKRAVPYTKFRPRFPLAVVIGSEIKGISRAILNRIDAVVEIPMYGKKESLNVAVAAGILLFSLRKE